LPSISTLFSYTTLFRSVIDSINGLFSIPSNFFCSISFFSSETAGPSSSSETSDSLLSSVSPSSETSDSLLSSVFSSSETSDSLLSSVFSSSETSDSPLSSVSPSSETSDSLLSSVFSSSWISASLSDSTDTSESYVASLQPEVRSPIKRMPTNNCTFIKNLTLNINIKNLN